MYRFLLNWAPGDISCVKKNTLVQKVTHTLEKLYCCIPSAVTGKKKCISAIFEPLILIPEVGICRLEENGVELPKKRNVSFWVTLEIVLLKLRSCNISLICMWSLFCVVKNLSWTFNRPILLSVVFFDGLKCFFGWSKKRDLIFDSKPWYRPLHPYCWMTSTKSAVGNHCTLNSRAHSSKNSFECNVLMVFVLSVRHLNGLYIL